MKIAFYRHSLLNRGGDKVIAAYANYLSDKGHDVVIWTNILDTNFKISNRVRVSRISYPGKLGTIIWSLFRPIEADIVIADIIVMAVILCLANRGKVLYFAQDYDVSYYSDKLRRKLVDFIYKVGLSIMGIPCVSVSYSLCHELAVYNGRVKIVQNGIDLNVFFPECDPELLAAKKSRRSILIFGRKDLRKGLDVALDVIQALSDKIKNEAFQIWVVGDYIEDNNSCFEVLNLGYVDEDKLKKVLSCVDVFIYPSRHEGLPLFVLEALACHCPVVTTKAVDFLDHLKEAWVSGIEDTCSLVDGVKYVLFECPGELFARKGKLLPEMYNTLNSCERFEKFLVGQYENRY